MSRSRKKTPITGRTTTASEKREKVKLHRRERKRVRQVMAVEPEAGVLPHRRDFGIAENMGKDGKVYRGSWKPAKAFRK